MPRASKQGKKAKRKKTLKETWNEELCKVTKNMAFMAIDDRVSSNEEA